MKNLFLIFVFLAIFLAWLNPESGIGRDALSFYSIANYGVSFVFFFYGLKLNGNKLKFGLKNLKLHILIQSSTFVISPCIILLCMQFFEIKNNYYEWIGFFFLATLPSTVSSSVVMVSLAKGNIPAAIFNASLSSLLGVFITPIWMSLFMSTTGNEYNLDEIFLKLILQVLIPLCIGLLLNKFLESFANRHSKILSIFDQSVILLIIYTSFCESFYSKMFDSFSLEKIIGLIAFSTAFFSSLYFVILYISRKLKFSREDIITATFCGSKKSLVHGSVMSRVIFTDPAIAGIILLPTMLYHSIQLIIISYIANKKNL